MKDPSQLFKAKFDSENGGGLISHAEVFEGLGSKCNARHSDTSTKGHVCCRLGSTSFDPQI